MSTVLETLKGVMDVADVRASFCAQIGRRMHGWIRHGRLSLLLLLTTAKATGVNLTIRTSRRAPNVRTKLATMRLRRPKSLRLSVSAECCEWSVVASVRSTTARLACETGVIVPYCRSAVRVGDVLDVELQTPCCKASRLPSTMGGSDCTLADDMFATSPDFSRLDSIYRVVGFRTE